MARIKEDGMSLNIQLEAFTFFMIGEARSSGSPASECTGITSCLLGMLSPDTNPWHYLILPHFTDVDMGQARQRAKWAQAGQQSWDENPVS